MNPASTVLRWYRQSTGDAPAQGQFTAEEVLQLLRPTNTAQTDGLVWNDKVRSADDRAARSEAVRQVAGQPSTWLDRLTKQQRQEIGDLADRLPSLVFHHAVGGDLETLVQRLGGWSTWRFERALAVAGSCIASHLNRVQML